MGASLHHPARPYLLAYAALLVVALAPMWLATIPPLGDYPNHLARMHILVNAQDSELLSRFYQVHWAVIPNLAMDLLVPPLAHVMPLAVAGKVFIAGQRLRRKSRAPARAA
ncbi:MAG: hypothetical protein A3G80_03875 [Betaproteobacteria bacterium RIFCSPLOWO2_12_FULL_62_13b]|nr:MAG: hypothetical protein A3G80_03875 [Betaproteobacteria bacterium RIFCSPLOWO2_12_FULL_62_13b]